jgi:fatty acid elongase 3
MSTPDWIRYGVPTLDRPFGLELWPIFEKAFEPIAGYKPQDFRFEQGVTPLSTFKTCASTLVVYYIVIFGGRELMRDREAFKLNFLFKVHNFYLTAISFILLALFAEQLIPTVARKGLFFAICDHEGGWTDKLVILYYVSVLWNQFIWILLTQTAQLPHQVPRAHRHLLPVLEEEASQYVFQTTDRNCKAN